MGFPVSNDELERQLTRVYSGWVKEVHRVDFPATTTEATYSHPGLAIPDAFIQFEQLASMPRLASRSGSTIQISKDATPESESVRFLILHPDTTQTGID